MTRGEVRSVVVRERAGCAIAVALNDDRGRAVFSHNDGAASANAVLNAARGGKVSRADMAAEVRGKRFQPLITHRMSTDVQGRSMSSVE